MPKEDRLPWITEDGNIDPAKLPIDYTLKQTLCLSKSFTYRRRNQLTQILKEVHWRKDRE